MVIGELPAIAPVKRISVYAGRDGWYYEVWIALRLVVFGCSSTRERAAQEAHWV
jgi:hypothetical protein